MLQEVRCENRIGEGCSKPVGNKVESMIYFMGACTLATAGVCLLRHCTAPGGIQSANKRQYYT